MQYAPLTERLIRDSNDFREWVFCSGMLFNSEHKWWGNRGKRNKPHEGLDLCLCRDSQDRIFCLDENTMLPAMYDGMVVGIVNDFLGKSILIEHSHSDRGTICIIYSHISPVQNFHVGSRVQEGDIIATLSDVPESKSGISPHLHISTGIIAENVSYEQLDWGTINNPNMFTLMDPLKLIGRYSILAECDLYNPKNAGIDQNKLT